MRLLGSPVEQASCFRQGVLANEMRPLGGGPLAAPPEARRRFSALQIQQADDPSTMFRMHHVLSKLLLSGPGPQTYGPL